VVQLSHFELAQELAPSTLTTEWREREPGCPTPSGRQTHVTSSQMGFTTLEYQNWQHKEPSAELQGGRER